MAKPKILTEDQVLKLFNMDGRQLGKLRSEYKLPYLAVDRYRRLYYEHRIFEWLNQREKNVVTEGDRECLSSDGECLSGDDKGVPSDDL